MAKRVYLFGKGITEGNGSQRNLLGGKGAGLAEMAKRGFNVPPGFTITTEVCTAYYENKRKMPSGLDAEVKKAITALEKRTGKQFGGNKNPLLVAVRSGARESMPGMMDTILNLGLNDTTVEVLKAKSNNGRFAYDSYRRFIQMYSGVVLDIGRASENEHDPFEVIIAEARNKRGVAHENQLPEEDLKSIIEKFKKLILEKTGKAFPSDPHKQLEGAIGAVFTSWMNERAILYRRKYKIPEEWGTAVNVQSMVFGNLGDSSGTGVAFTRNPATGENEFYGEFLVNAQGEDVVAGIRTPLKISAMATTPHLEHCYKELCEVRKLLEKEFGDMQDFEFTIEDGKLYMLQTRNGKRTARAYVKIAKDMVKQKLMTQEHAIASADPEAIEQLLAPVFDKDAYQKAIGNNLALTKGLPAGPGAATGTLAFTAEKAERWAKHGPVVLARVETSPEDLRGMLAAAGIITAKGGVSSHAAVVARQMGKVCVVGASDIDINYNTGVLTCGDKTIKEGEFISINGSTGEVFCGKISTAPSELVQVLIDKTLAPKDSELFEDYNFVMNLADKYRKLGIRTNADQPEQAVNAVAFGAEGIGLCRTEHMFFKGERINYVREMIIFAEEYAEYKAKLVQRPSDAVLLENEYHIPIMHFRNALDKLLPIQQEDFEGIFSAMGERPVTVRYLDPPLHEFLPQSKDQIEELAHKLNISFEKVAQIIGALHESNPMLGHRGCRLGIAYPEISEMQSRALFRAALAVAAKNKKSPKPEIMIPLVGFERELELQLEIVNRVAKEEFAAAKRTLEYKVGTMIEIPRAAITAEQIAKHAQFFSFGTNDLTQTTLGMSRDDAGHFLPFYEKEAGIVKSNPFATLDQIGVGKLMEIAVQGGKKVRPDIKLGICGEHGGDPSSIEFCNNLGLNYVSCSPFRVPVARIAAAKSAVKAGAVVVEAKKAVVKKAAKPVAKKAVKAKKKVVAKKK
ncbi:MAG: pyruvate, phosphate dikinase [Fibromonadaceae bacterium]|jgi:pyruvate,orthophosphate dikinase|nr:pyruvate, phosphate dikinase [Fibromonadaceae bacterium]